MVFEVLPPIYLQYSYLFLGFLCVLCLFGMYSTYPIAVGAFLVVHYNPTTYYFFCQSNTHYNNLKVMNF